MTTNVRKRPVPIPLPWVLGRLWRLRATGLLQGAGPVSRAFILYGGDLAGLWTTPEDPVLTPGSLVQAVLALRPRYLETDLPAHGVPVLQTCRDIASRIGSGPWTELLFRLIVDTTARAVPLTWTSQKDLALPEGLTPVSTPLLLWRLAAEAEEVLDRAARAAIPAFSESARLQVLADLGRDTRMPPRVRSALDAESRVPTRVGTRFLSFFWVFGETPTPVPSPAPSPSPEPPIRLEEYAQRWEELRAFAHQSRRWTHYRVLGLTPEATPDQIRDRYRQLAAVFHPDRWPQVDERQRSVLTQVFSRIQTAYDVLSDAVERRRYDRSLRAQEPAVEVIEDRTGRIDPKTLQGFYHRGLRAFLRGNMSEAVRWLDSVAAATSDWTVQLLLALAESHVPERRRSAAQRLERLSQAHPEAAEVWWVYARALYHWQFLARARQTVEEVRRRNPSLLKQWGDPGRASKTPTKAWLRFFLKPFSESPT